MTFDTGCAVVQVTASATYERTFGTSGSAGSGNNQFSSPRVVCYGNDLVYVADYSNHRVQVLRPDGTYVRTCGTSGRSGSANHQFNGLFGVCAGTDGYLYVADNSN